ncbi:hypothetical protein JOM56_015293 [Amanita muscaria]
MTISPFLARYHVHSLDLGSVLLAWISTPVIALANKLGFVSSKFDLQIIGTPVESPACASKSQRRWVVLYETRNISTVQQHNKRSFCTFNVFTISFAVLDGKDTAEYVCTASRYEVNSTLCTFQPLFLVVDISTSLLIGHNPVSVRQSKRAYKAAIALLSFTAIVFRAAISLLLALLSLQLLITRKLTVLELIKVGLYSSVTSIALTILVDSYFWQTFPLWPELHGIYFNVYEGKSVEWGNYLPKLLLSSLPLACIGAILDNRITSLLFPSLSFIALISWLGHKEWRFVTYVVPIFNLAAAKAASFLIFRKPPLLRRAFISATTGIITTNLLITIVFALSSLYNYPGG